MSAIEMPGQVHPMVDEMTSAVLRAQEALENKELVSVLGMSSPIEEKDGIIFQEMPVGVIEKIHKNTGRVEIRVYRRLSGLVRSGGEGLIETSATRVIFFPNQRQTPPKEEYFILTPEFAELKKRMEGLVHIHIPGITVGINYLRNDEKGSQVNEMACGFISEIQGDGIAVVHLKRGPRELHGRKIEIFPSNIMVTN